MVAASIAAAACTEVLEVVDAVSRSDLAVLVMQQGTPAPASIQFYVANNRVTTRTLVHPDQFNQTFAQVSFPSGSLATIGGAPAASSDSVLVTVQPEPGTYGLTIAASGVTFSSANAPTVSFFYGRYGDFVTSRTGSRYTSATQLAAALEVWREQALDRYSATQGAAVSGPDAIAGRLPSTGNYLVAAPK
jgi:hypothetical protein